MTIERPTMTRQIVSRSWRVLLAIALVGCGQPAQIGPDRDTFKAVDALYTAVSMRDPKLVDQCETQLIALKTEGKLPTLAYDSLTAIIGETRSGQWEPAYDHLHAFMSGQRKE